MVDPAALACHDGETLQSERWAGTDAAPEPVEQRWAGWKVAGLQSRPREGVRETAAEGGREEAAESETRMALELLSPACPTSPRERLTNWLRKRSAPAKVVDLLRSCVDLANPPSLPVER